MARVAVLAVLAALLAPASQANAAAGEGGFIQPANNDIGNIASLQRGAKYFVNYCLGCHSANYVRYNRLAEDLGITEEQLIDNLMFTGERPYDTMISAMRAENAERWFGTAPSDLSLIARSRGTDWIYSYLKSFYLDDARPTGTNNLVLEATAMPHVLWELQGWQQPVVHEAAGDAAGPVAVERLEPATQGMLSAAEFDRVVRDLANFLDYVSEPVQLERRRLGIRVILFLLVFLLFAYLLKKEYWKQVR